MANQKFIWFHELILLLGCHLLEAQVYERLGTLTKYNGYDVTPRDVILPDTGDVIQVEGVIHSWSAYFGNAGYQSRVRLQIWRPLIDNERKNILENSTSGHGIPGVFVARLVGQSDYRYWRFFGEGFHNFTLEHHERIRLEKGDMIGLEYASGNPVPFQDVTGCGVAHSGVVRRMDVYSTIDFLVDPNENPYRRFSIMEPGHCRRYSMVVQMSLSDCKEIIASSTMVSLEVESSEGFSDHCWVITIPGPQSVVYVDVQNVNIASSCSSPQAYLEIRNGSSSSSSLLKSFCETFTASSTRHALFKSKVSGALYIRFVTYKSSTQSNNFWLKFWKVLKPRVPGNTFKCSLVMVDSFPAILSSTNYPLKYPPNTDLCWLVRTVASSARLVVEVRELNLQFPEEAGKRRVCTDFVRVYDGDTLDYPRLSEWCGNDNPKELFSTGTQVLVWFSTDDSVEGDGFLLRVHAQIQEPLGCTRLVANGKEQYFQSSGYPSNYPPVSEACWVVESPSRVLLTIYELFLEESDSCSYDYLEFRDGSDKKSPLLARRCATESGSYVVSSRSHLYIRFESDWSVERRGFRLGYIETNTKICTIHSAYAYFLEFRYPGYGTLQYPLDTCWTIVAPLSSDRVKVEFKDFVMQDNFECNKESATVYDGGDWEAPMLGRWCGNHSDIGVLSTGQSLTVRLITDTTQYYRRFSLSYIALPSDCKILFASGERQWLKSDDYPYPYHANTKDCWIIEATTNQDILIFNVISVNIDGPNVAKHKCDRDSLSIHDGNHQAANRLMTVCGDDIPNKNIITSGRFAMIIFQSDETGEKSGFQITYHSQKEERCITIQVHKAVGTLTYPGYPIIYEPHSFRCWILRVSTPNSTIRLMVDDFDLPSDCKDHIDVIDGDSAKDGRFRRWCGGKRPGGMISSSSTLTIRFLSDGSVFGRGFKLSFWEEVEPNMLQTTHTPHTTTTPTSHTTPTTTLNMQASSSVSSLDPPTMYKTIHTTGKSLTGPSTRISSGRPSSTPPISKTSLRTTPVYDCLRILIRSDASNILSSRRHAMDSNGGMDRCWVLSSSVEEAKLNVKLLTFYTPEQFCGQNATQFLELRDGRLPSSALMTKVCGRNFPRETFITTTNSVYLRFVVETSESYFVLQCIQSGRRETFATITTAETPTRVLITVQALREFQGSSVNPVVIGVSVGGMVVFLILVFIAVCSYTRVCSTSFRYANNRKQQKPKRRQKSQPPSTGGTIRASVHVLSTIASTFEEIDRMSQSTAASVEFYGMPKDFDYKQSKQDLPWRNGYPSLESLSLADSNQSLSNGSRIQFGGPDKMTDKMQSSLSNGKPSKTVDSYDPRYTPAKNERMV